MQGMKNRRAFTLIEVVIVVGIVAVMTSLVWGTFARTFKAKEIIQDANQRYHAVRVVLDRMAMDITNAFVAPYKINSNTGTIFKGEESSPIAKLTMSTFSHIRMIRNSKECEQTVVAYYGRPHEKHTRFHKLFRREKKRLDEKPEQGGVGYVLLDRVLKLEFKYWKAKQQEWSGDWDTTKVESGHQPPPMVEIRLTIEDERGKELTLITRASPAMDRAVGQ